MSVFDKTQGDGLATMPAMEIIDSERLDRAERCIWQSARVLERLRFAHLFRGAASAPVLQALSAYKNDDGGFGHAIEPDFRGPISQPLGSDFALRVLHELPTQLLTHDKAVLQDSLRYLRANTAADGGVPNVLPSVAPYPRAPWWQAASEDPPGSLLPTAGIAGLLYAFRVEDPWLSGATEFVWRGIGQLPARAAQASERIARLFVAYEARAALTFLDHVPDRTRAERAAAELGEALLAAKLVAVEPDALAEAAQPLEFAPTPQSLAARWLARAVFDQHLDAWVRAQAADGGWDVPWLIWTPVTQHEWRGVQTLERLKTLRAWGRCLPAGSR
jgi:hypothetical protein